MEFGPALQVVGVIISGVVIPLVLAMRRENREAVHELRTSVHAVDVKIARLEERDRVTELLDRRLPPRDN